MASGGKNKWLPKKSFCTENNWSFWGDLTGKTIAILGWTFKKDTNDSRESAAIYITAELIEKGALVHVYDPMVTSEIIYDDLKKYWESKDLSRE